MGAIRIGWWWGFYFHARTLHILIVTELFWATYDELVLLTKAWKMHTPFIKVVVNILIELASKWGRYTGGKLAMVCHPDTCPIWKSGTYRWTSRDNHGSCHANSFCMWLLESIIYKFHKSSMGVFATWQDLELWVLVGSGFNMVSFRLRRGQWVAHLMHFRCL